MVLAVVSLKLREIVEAIDYIVVPTVNDPIGLRSYPQDGRRVCQKWTTNAIVR